MADQSLAAGSSQPLTKHVSGDGTSTLTYTLPAGVYQYVQSVNAVIDTSASGDVSPTLTVREADQTVIADKQQDDAIDGGGSGRATWALRLTASTRAGIRFGRTNTGNFLDVVTTSHGGSANYGINLETTGASTSNGIRLSSVADVSLYADTTAQMYGASLLQLGVTDAGQQMLLGTNGGDIALDTTGGPVTIEAGSTTFHTTGNNLWQLEGGVRIEGSASGLTSVDLDTALLVTLEAGATLTVRDHLGNPIFRVNEDGSLQGKTGKALTFNL